MTMNVDVLNLPLPWSSFRNALKGADSHKENNLRLDFEKVNGRSPSEDDTVETWWDMWSLWNLSWPNSDIRYLEIVLRLELVAVISKVHPDRVADCVSALDVFALTMAKNIASIQSAWTDIQDQVQGCVDALESRDSERIVTAKVGLHAAIESKRQNPNYSLGSFERNGLTAMEDIMIAETTDRLSLRAHLLKTAHYMVANLSESKRADHNGGSPDYESKLFGEI
jgi:hypothetical protein